MKKIFAISAIAFMLTGCFGRSALYNEPVSPESLLDLSSERVSFTLNLSDSIDQLTEWVNNDQPSKAEVHCAADPAKCTEAEGVLTQFGVPFERKEAKGGDEVVLLYDRIFTRDCQGADGQARLGCSVSANSVQMVVDPRQFLDPALLDLQDAEKAAGVYEQYLQGGKGKKPHGHGQPHHQ